jgi:UDP-N-acetyl-D-mannosaminuronate dehydrogenase
VADIRESPVEQMVEELKDFETVVYGYDPLLPESVIEHFGAIPLQQLDKPMDAVIVSVAHQSFKDMTAAEIGKLMPDRPVLVDVRGILDPAEARNAGMDYRRL